MRSPRQLKVGEEVRHVLAQLFQRDDVPWPREFKAPIVTISEVQVSPDLRNATVFFTTLGGQQTDETRRVLRDMAGFFRHALAKAVRLRFVPALVFKVDTSFEYAHKIEKLLSDPVVARDLHDDDQGLDPESFDDQDV